MAKIETLFHVGGGGVFNCVCDVPLDDISDFVGECPVFTCGDFPQNARVFQEYTKIPNYRIIVIQSKFGTNTNAQNVLTKSTTLLRDECLGCNRNINQR